MFQIYCYCYEYEKCYMNGDLLQNLHSSLNFILSALESDSIIEISAMTC